VTTTPPSNVPNAADDATRLHTQTDLPTERRADPDATLHNPDLQATRLAPTRGPATPATATRNSTQTNPYGYGEGHAVVPRPGARVLRGRFELQEPPLGSGGMGDVYLARDLLREEMQDSTPYVALKLLNDTCRQLPGALQALQREAKKAQTLSHPNIVTVYDFDKDGDDAFITMEYLKGVSLKLYLHERLSLSQAEGLVILEKIARGLAYAHQEGFVHADIKPANIYITDNQQVKILDLGIAQAFNEAYKEAPSAADELTKNALTPAYASPEMLAGEASLPSDDVYALGCVAYELFAGRHPFLDERGRVIPADQAQQLDLLPKPISGIDKRLMLAIKRALAFDRQSRFADAGAFIDAIKPRNYKKDAVLLLSAVAVSALVILLVNLGLKAVVPSIDSLAPELASVAQSLKEADGLLAAGDIDMAHRLYAESWELSNQAQIDPLELDKAHAIVRDRMNAVAEHLIEKSQASDLDEFRLRELAVALEFMQKDQLTDKEKRIKKALARIQARLAPQQ
jgi:serine/threonine protein kinase